jgi:hypothetical protein
MSSSRGTGEAPMNRIMSFWTLALLGVISFGQPAAAWSQETGPVVRPSALPPLPVPAPLDPVPADPVPAGQDQPPATEQQAGDESHSRISDEYIPLQLEGFPSRPKPLLELGSPFLGTGNIRGFTGPGGAEWTPSFLLFGTARTGVSTSTSYDGAGDEITTNQWSNRFDLFGNLSLTFTERFVFGLRPIDETDPTGARRFTGYRDISGPGGSSGDFTEHFNFGWGTVSHLFFEGDFGELFPGLDRSDTRGLDYGLAIGRQPLSFQEGTLVNDTLDAIGITRNSLTVGSLMNTRITGVYAWNQINRNTPSSVGVRRNREADSSHLVGLFTEFDARRMTISIDGVFVAGGDFTDEDGLTARAGDGVYAGVSFVGRPGGGTKNLAVRFLISQPIGDESESGRLDLTDPASRGSLILTEYSWTPHHSLNYFYANGFVAIDDYRAAALDPLVPGPLARVGVLFEGSGLGEGAPLSPTASDAVGAAFGHQRFYSGHRRQVLFEAAARYSTLECPGDQSSCDPQLVGGGVRFQVAAGRRFVFGVTGSVVGESLRGLSATVAGTTWRVRREIRFELLTQL